MVMLVLDTDHLTALGYRNALGQRLLDRLAESGQEVATTVVNVDEQLSGLLAALHAKHDPDEQIQPYAELVERIEFLAAFLVLPWDADSARILRDLKAKRVRVGTMDLKVASISLAHDVTLLTRNAVDFAKVPNLRFENWLD